MSFFNWTWLKNPAPSLGMKDVFVSTLSDVLLLWKDLEKGMPLESDISGNARTTSSNSSTKMVGLRLMKTRISSSLSTSPKLLESLLPASWILTRCS
jgi:hypothetical protein